MTTASIAVALLQRDLRLAMRRRGEAALPLGFFVVVAALQPLGVNPQPNLLREIGPGVVWMAALLAALLPLPSLFSVDHADGTLELMVLADTPLWMLAISKVAAHWLTSGAPLVVLAPLLGLMYGLDETALAVLALGLAIGTPVLSLVGTIGAALTTGLRSAGSLILLLVLPLCVPVLIFGTGAVQATQAGQSAAPHLSLLGAQLVLTLMVAPVLIAHALRIAVE
ncbi:MAG: heme exporter protein CcmB [Pseudomonadota bacterium]